MKKKFIIAALSAVMGMSLSMVSYAASWQNNENGWKYQNDDGTFTQNTWQWIDGNNDGVSESYYFDANGYLLTNTTTPDGYTVNQDGAWVDNGLIQQKTAAKGPGSQAGDAKQIYLDAVKKSSELSSMEADANINMSVTSSGVTIAMDMYMNMKYKDLNTSNMKFLSTTRMNFLGEEILGTSFYTDGYYYTNANGSKRKTAMNIDILMSQIKGSMNMSNVDYSYMKDFQMATDENGNRVITYGIDSAGLMEQINQIYKSIGMDMTEYNMTLSNMYGTAVVSPDGFCQGEKINMTMGMETGGETASVTMAMDMQYKNPGQPVDFTLPSTDGYVEEVQR